MYVCICIYMYTQTHIYNPDYCIFCNDHNLIHLYFPYNKTFHSFFRVKYI